MPTIDEKIATLEASVASAEQSLEEVKTQIDTWVTDGTWDALTEDQRSMKTNQITKINSIINERKRVLENFKESYQNFYDVYRPSEISTFDATYQAQRDVLLNELQSKEDYIKATSYVDLAAYRKDWREFLAAVASIDAADDASQRIKRWKADWAAYLAATTDTTMSYYQVDWQAYIAATGDTSMKNYTAGWNTV